MNYIELFGIPGAGKTYIQKTIINKNNKVYFLTSEKKSYHKIGDLLGIENSYKEILRILEKKIIKGKSTKFYRMILKEINSLNIDTQFNDKLKKWFLESLVLAEIQKKENFFNCVVDEGIVHRVFSIFCLKKNKKSFVKKVIQYYEKYGDLYLVKTDLKKIYKRTVKREKIRYGFVYEDKKQIQNYYNNLKLFLKK